MTSIIVDLERGIYTETSESLRSGAPIQDLILKSDTSVSFDTGLIPVSGTGLINLRMDQGEEVAVWQLEPTVQTIVYNGLRRPDRLRRSHDGQGNYPADCYYKIALPWRLLIGTRFAESAVSVRLLFSDGPITSMDDPLYAPPLPSVSLTGYHEMPIGWVCWHPRLRGESPDLAQAFPRYVKALYETVFTDGIGTYDGQYYADHGDNMTIKNLDRWAQLTADHDTDWFVENLKTLFLPIYKTSAPYRARPTGNDPFTFKDIFTYNISETHNNHWNNPGSKKSILLPKTTFTLDQINSSFRSLPELKDLISEGWECAHCQNRYKPNDSKFAVVTEFVFIDEDDERYVDGEDIRIADEMSEQEWCESCFESASVYVTELDSYVPVSEMVWDQSENRWDFSDRVSVCAQCSFTWTDNEKFLVLSRGAAGWSRTHCVKCTPHHTEESNTYRYDIKDLEVFMVPGMVVTDDVVSVGEVPIYLQVRLNGYGDRDRLLPYVSYPCACGVTCQGRMLSNVEVNGRHACATCVRNGEYDPMYVIDHA